MNFYDSYTLKIFFQISPMSGPVKGGTSINVFANYEGNSTDEIFLSIAEANCTGVIVKDKANS